VVGAGGHAKVVTDALRCVAERGGGQTVVGFVDDNPTLWGHTVLGLPVLGNLDELRRTGADAVIVAIGDKAARKRVFERVRVDGYRLVNAIHPTAVIARDVSIGEGVVVFANAVVNAGSVVGSNVILNTATTVDHDCTIANHVHLAPGVHAAGGVAIGEGTFVGTGASVVPYRKIGRWVVLGAGSVVVDDIPDEANATGVPAKIRRGF